MHFLEIRGVLGVGDLQHSLHNIWMCVCEWRGGTSFCVLLIFILILYFLFFLSLVFVVVLLLISTVYITLGCSIHEHPMHTIKYLCIACVSSVVFYFFLYWKIYLKNIFTVFIVSHKKHQTDSQLPVLFVSQLSLFSWARALFLFRFR